VLTEPPNASYTNKTKLTFTGAAVTDRPRRAGSLEAIFGGE
jgi:hypothetical protein